MQVITSTTTIASYCEEMEEGKIIINRDYQRSRRVWPAKARSYLIDTILLGFPVPKLSLYQMTDLKSRKTIKEIVDGQQRSTTILDFYQDKFRIAGNSEFSGLSFTTLDPELQSRFLEYQLSLDIFVGATREQIRQVFRRINSYTVPLNRQELRHATYQGEFKWFIVRLVEKYAQVLKEIGTFSESQLSRMKDAALFTEVIAALEEGIVSASEKKLDNFYKRHDDVFQDEGRYSRLFDDAFDLLLDWEPIHKSALVKTYNLYTLLLAVMHHLHPFDALQGDYVVNSPVEIDRYETLRALGELADALAEPEQAEDKFDEFVEANSKATNRVKQRKTRFVYFCNSIIPR